MCSSNYTTSIRISTGEIVDIGCAVLGDAYAVDVEAVQAQGLGADFLRSMSMVSPSFAPT